MNPPLVSIIVCCHNRAQLLPQTMDSIFAQSYRPVEIVVVDDGSTDETPQLMEAYGDKIRYIRQENQGVAVARTTGGRMAKGEFIAFQDDDDLMVPDRIQLLMDGYKKFPSVVLSVGDYAFIDPDANLTGEKSHFKINDEINKPIRTPFYIEDGYTSVLWPKLTPLPHTTLFRKEDGDRINWFDKRFFYACSDTDFYARLGQLGPIVYVPQIVSYYRWGHSSLWKNRIFSTYSRFLLLEKHIQSIGNKPSVLKNRLRQRLCTILKQLAMYKKENDKNQILSTKLFERGLTVWTATGRFNFRLYKNFVLPIRMKIMGTNIDVSLIDFLYRKFIPQTFRNKN